MHTYLHLVSCCRSRCVVFHWHFIQSRQLTRKTQTSTAVGGPCQHLEGMAQCAATHSPFLDQGKPPQLLGGCKISLIPPVVVSDSPPPQHCRQHKFLLDQNFVISEDDGDFLCLLLYCARKPQWYKQRGGQGYNLKESKQVIDLLWNVRDLPPLEVSHW